jgi:hypothetical protein
VTEEHITATPTDVLSTAVGWPGQMQSIGGNQNQGLLFGLTRSSTAYRS